MKLDYKGLFSNWEIAVAKKLINEYLKRWPCLQREGFDDLLQECLIHWLSIRDSYDFTRGASQSTYMGRVIRNKLMDLIREREADRRRLAYSATSLHEPLEDGKDLEDTIVDTHPAVYSQMDLRMDIPEALQKLTPKHKELCNLLGEKGLNIKEASKCLNTPRSTVHDEIKRIRKIFVNEGLGEYLE